MDFNSNWEIIPAGNNGSATHERKIFPGLLAEPARVAGHRNDCSFARPEKKSFPARRPARRVKSFFRRQGIQRSQHSQQPGLPPSDMGKPAQPAKNHSRPRSRLRQPRKENHSRLVGPGAPRQKAFPGQAREPPRKRKTFPASRRAGRSSLEKEMPSTKNHSGLIFRGQPGALGGPTPRMSSECTSTFLMTASVRSGPASGKRNQEPIFKTWRWEKQDRRWEKPTPHKRKLELYFLVSKTETITPTPPPPRLCKPDKGKAFRSNTLNNVGTGNGGGYESDSARWKSAFASNSIAIPENAKNSERTPPPCYMAFHNNLLLSNTSPCEC